MAKSMGRGTSEIHGSCLGSPGPVPRPFFVKNITLSEKLKKFYRKIEEKGKFDIPNTHIHDRSLS
jgi:hypothetical protein